MSNTLMTEPAPQHTRFKWVKRFAVVLILFAVVLFLWRVLFSERVVQRRSTNVVIDMVLPPPPEPIKPEPEKEVEIKDQETPKQPTEVSDPQPTPEDFNDALTAREGVTGNEFGAQVGDGGGSRIGGKPGGGDASRAYGVLVTKELKRILQADTALARGNYEFQIEVSITEEGVVQRVQFTRGSGDARRDAAIEKLFTGQRISRTPPLQLAPMLMAYRSRLE